MGYFANKEEEPVILHLDEYEAIRLLDYEGLSQVEAASFMEVSRPTLTRIYERARKKIATALTEARQVLIEGGRTIFNGEWYECKECGSTFNANSQTENDACLVCGCTDISLV